MHRESGDADIAAMEAQLPMLRQICEDYNREDIFNADETVINYRMPPDRTIYASPLQGRKKDKKANIVGVCKRKWIAEVSVHDYWKCSSAAMLSSQVWFRIGV